MDHAEIIVKGRVQGVGFRYFVMQKAIEIGIKGYVKNLSNRDVLVFAQGNKIDIATLLDYLKIGPSHSRVDSVDITWINGRKEFPSFSVKY